MVAWVAGATLGLAAHLALAMTLLQLGIGTVNDVVDAPSDAGRKPGKAIPAGLVSLAAARWVAGAFLAAGVLLGWAVSPAVATLSLVVIAIGLAYDLRLKGTRWSWLPFAVGIPILPVYGWLGARGDLDPIFLVLVPVAMVAGAALALGNAAVDVERDRTAGATSLAADLGLHRAMTVTAGLFAAVALAAVVSAVLGQVPPLVVLAVALVGVVPVIAALTARAASPAGRERAWQAEAIAAGLLAAIWLAGVAGAAGPR